MSTSGSLYSALVNRSREAEAQLPDGVRADVPRNGLLQVLASALQSSGDKAMAPSTVLPWLLHAMGAPAALTGLLVPIRESGSMLPQAFLTPLVLRIRHRKWVVILGQVVQALAVAAMAMAAAVATGLGGGVAIIFALAVFSLGRCLTSIGTKDVMGRTLPKGERGQINGLSTTASGMVAITLGLGIRALGGEDLSAGQLAWLLAGAAVLWAAAAVAYAAVREPADDPAASDPAAGDGAKTAGNGLRLLIDDPLFRSFVTTRSFLLVSALSPPFVVTLAVSSGSSSLAGLGGFVIASGIASIIGGRVFGRAADRSSRKLMAYGAAAASVVIVALVVAVSLPGFSGSTLAGTLVLIGGYLLLTMLHTGVRVGRKTYIVDMADGDLRTVYVAVSNTAMGVILLVVGGISSLLALWGVVWALLFLAVLGMFGSVWGLRLPEVSQAG